jgi:hypothetical protein
VLGDNRIPDLARRPHQEQEAPDQEDAEVHLPTALQQAPVSALICFA